MVVQIHDFRMISLCIRIHGFTNQKQTNKQRFKFRVSFVHCHLVRHHHRQIDFVVDGEDEGLGDATQRCWWRRRR